MTYKQFGEWCNARAADGHWSYSIAIVCCQEYSKVVKLSFLKRRKKFKEEIPKEYQEIVDSVNAYYNLNRKV